MKPIAHGTNRGYRAHLARWEHSCDPCREAHNAYERTRVRTAPKPPRQLHPCGTPAAWRRHKRNDEEPCEACVLAHRADAARSGRRAA
jgi:hypothetical protein